MLFNSKLNVTNPKQFYPSGSDLGSDLVSENIGGVQVMLMPRTAIGIFNEGVSDISISIVGVHNDHTKPMKVIVKPNTMFTGIQFNAVLPLLSTGHNSATTHYLTDYNF